MLFLKHHLLFLFALLLSVKLLGQTTPAQTEILNKCIAQYANNPVIKFDAVLNYKTFDDSAYYTFNYKANFLAKPKDTVFGTYFDYTCNRKGIVYSKLYFGDQLYYIDNDSNEIWTYNPHNKERSPINGAFDGKIVEFSFLFDSVMLRNQLFSKYNIAPKDTVMNGQAYLIVTAQFPDKGEYTNANNRTFINKKTFWIDRFSTYIKYYDQEQIQILDYANMQPSDFSFVQKNAYLDSLQQSGYKVRKYERRKLQKLEIGEQVLPFVAQLYPSTDSMSIPEKGKITIIDFWYTSCLPCVKSIPDLNKIYEKYKNEIVMYGVNPFPDDMGKPERVAAFLKRTPIHYPILVANGEDDLGHLKINGFPTIYVVDKEGRLVYQQMGYNEDEDLVQILEEIIQQCTNK